MAREDNSVFEYSETASMANIKIVHDTKHQSYRITVSKVYRDNRASATIIIPEAEFPFKYLK